MDERLHWVMTENDEHLACGPKAEGKVRATNLELDAGHEACSTCFTLWTRYSVRQAA